MICFFPSLTPFVRHLQVPPGISFNYISQNVESLAFGLELKKNKLLQLKDFTCLTSLSLYLQGNLTCGFAFPENLQHLEISGYFEIINIVLPSKLKTLKISVTYFRDMFEKLPFQYRCYLPDDKVRLHFF